MPCLIRREGGQGWGRLFCVSVPCAWDAWLGPALPFADCTALGRLFRFLGLVSSTGKWEEAFLPLYQLY